MECNRMRAYKDHGGALEGGLQEVVDGIISTKVSL
jgi:hypothetical protein